MRAFIWEAAFGDVHTDRPDWLVSEYELPVPQEWRDEIGLSYRAPDFVCGAGNRLLIIELKTDGVATHTPRSATFSDCLAGFTRLPRSTCSCSRSVAGARFAT